MILFAVGFSVYANSFIDGMFWDDYDSVINNQYIRSFDHFPDYFTKNLTAGAGITDNYWRPLLLVSFATDYSLGGIEPFFYHFQNFLWHLAAAMLVFLVGTRLSKNTLASLVAALLFLVHPLQTEAVTYVAGRADPMHTALLLGSLLLFLRHLESRKRSEILWSLALFVLSLLAKERAIVFPVVLALILFLVPLEGYARNWKKRVLLLSPYAAIAGTYAVLRLTVLHFADTFDPGARTILIGTASWQKTSVFLGGMGTYAKLIVWPARLFMEKSFPVPQSILDPTVLLGLACLTLSAMIMYVSYRRKTMIAFCVLAFFATLLPSMYIYPVQGLLYEHWLYPAFPWLFLAVGIGLSPFLDPKLRTGTVAPATLAAVFAVAIAALGARTIARNFDWQDPITFYEKNVALGGVSGRVYTNLGMAYDDADRHDDAIRAYRSAVDLSGDTLFQPWFDLGNTLYQQGKPDEAMDAYRHALALNPRFASAYVNIAKIYDDAKDTTAAIDVLKKAERDNPRQVQILFAIAAISANAGDTATAAAYAEKVLALDPNDARAAQILSFVRSRAR